MAWINATTHDGRNANLNTRQISAILDLKAGEPQRGSEVLFVTGVKLEVRESPAQLLRAIDTGEHPENPPVEPDQAW